MKPEEVAKKQERERENILGVEWAEDDEAQSTRGNISTYKKKTPLF